MAIWNIIFPSKCLICDFPFIIKDQNLVCEDCISEIRKSEIYYCRSCGITCDRCYPVCENCKVERVYEQIEAFTDYSKVEKILKNYKLSGYKNLAGLLANLIREDLTSFIKQNNIQTVLYVPLSKKVLKKRGFNHLELILRQIVPPFMLKNWLIKTKETKFQMDLDAKERQTNLKDAFALSEDAKFYGQNILVFDDVSTTGSTLKEIAKLLKTQNTGKIYGYVIAKV